MMSDTIKVGDKVISSGYSATVMDLPEWAPGMATVRFASGDATVPREDLTLQRNQRRDAAALLLLAQDYGHDALIISSAAEDEWDDRQAGLRARMAARYAFRAVPALRGKE